MNVISVQIGRAKVYGDEAKRLPENGRWKSGFVKSPVRGPVYVHPLGPEGDEQADRVHHGGPDKAVLGYGSANYLLWEQDLGFAMPNGAFGENLTISEMDERSVCIGDTYQIGDLVVEVSQARIPCWKINRRWNRSDLLQRVRDTGRTGWYFRVLQSGAVQAGDCAQLLQRPAPDWTIERVNDAIHGRLSDSPSLTALANLPWLAASQKEVIEARLRKLNGLSD